MKIRSVKHNNRKKVFEVHTSAKSLIFPFSKADPTLTIEDPVSKTFVDEEAGREAFTYVLAVAPFTSSRSSSTTETPAT